MKPANVFLVLMLLCASFSGCAQSKVYHPPVAVDLRAPAYPLITIDPYTSGWSYTDNLYDGPVRHWTGETRHMIGVIRVDGQNYRFLGEEVVPMQMIVPSYEKEHWISRYTTDKPEGDWTSEDYNDSSWDEGKGSFGSPGGRLKAITRWRTPDIWVRRVVNIDAGMLERELFIEYSHDDGMELYINGHEVINTGHSARSNVRYRIPDEAVKYLKPGKNVIAVHCNDTGGESYLDFGIWMRKNDKAQFAQTANQKSVDVLPTSTYYTFEAGGVELDVIFTTPLLMDDLDLLSRPVSYITYQVKSTDGNQHEVSVYFEGSPQWAQDKVHQPVESEFVKDDKLHLLKSGTKSQEILGKSGDAVRCDWGYVYFAAPKGNNVTSAIGATTSVQEQFINNGELAGTYEPGTGDLTENMEALSIAHKLGRVGSDYSTGYVMLAYDDIYSIQYFGENLRPYWNRSGNKTIAGQIQAAVKEYSSIMDKCHAFDAKLMKDARKAGGKEYAELCALAYRQAISAHKLVESPDEELLWFSKENNSNGSIGTVDITYPSSPLFLYYNVELVKGMMNHIFYYSESGKWTKPFPAHDVGTYPLANGQTYGGDMPIEEGGNMLALTAAIAAVEGNARYAEKHWDVLTVWADYLVEYGLDPENQLCTDDFAGHFAHNANLSVKAIMGIASYSYVANMLGKKDIADRYYVKAKEMAQEWVMMADDGDHYRLTFDKPGTWSQKYNLIWDKLLKFDIFPEAVAHKELAYYLTKQNEYGLPLDNRRQYTKSDWIMWTATLADSDELFRLFIDPMYKFYNETTDRIPMSDWYFTDSKRHRGFKARSVVGGYYIKMLSDRMLSE